MADVGPGGHNAQRFGTTQWSQVLAAGDSQSAEFETALTDLCQRYWYPAYAHLRRRGVGAEAARDLTQGFFCHLLEKRTFRAADPSRGRFRSFLLGALDRFAADQRNYDQALKRGGRSSTISIDFEAAERHYVLEAGPQEDPALLFTRRWALRLLDYTHDRLRQDLAGSAHPERSRRLAAFLTDSETRPYREVAEELAMSESAVKVAIHRLRQRFGRLLREEVARTLNDTSQIDDEIRFLFAALET